MKKFFAYNILFFYFIISAFQSYGNDTIQVSTQDIRLKSKSTTTLYFSFHQGDIVLFSIKEKKNKKLALFSIKENEERIVYNLLNNHLKHNGLFYVPSTKVYSFTFYNDAFTARNITFEVSRIPSSKASKNFKTTPIWIDKMDTIYDIRKEDEIIRFDSTWYNASTLVRDSCRNTEEITLDQTIRLESSISIRKKNRAVIEIVLNKSTSSELFQKKPIAWAYWIGVGEEAQESWNQTVKNIAKLTGGLLSTFVNPLLGFAVGIIPEFIVPTSGKNISYWFVEDTSQVNKFMNKKDFESIEHGKAIVSYGKSPSINSKKLYLCILNESAISPAEVNIKFVVVSEECNYKIGFEKKLQIKPVYKREKANNPIYNHYKIPVVDQYHNR